MSAPRYVVPLWGWALAAALLIAVPLLLWFTA